MQTSLRGIANKATTDKTHRFRNLFGLLTDGFLEWCWQFVNLRAAPGVDRVTARKSWSKSAGQPPGARRDGQSGTVSGQVGAQKIYPQARWEIEAAGVPTIADKLLQTAVAKILEAIYEADFLPCSYGYRPGIGLLDAVRELSHTLEQGLYHYVVEADIQGFFDHIDHERLPAMLAERIDDRPFLGLIRKWLKAGILETVHPAMGTPQGGAVSSILANVYLHHVLDQWFEETVKAHCSPSTA